MKFFSLSEGVAYMLGIWEKNLAQQK